MRGSKCRDCLEYKPHEHPERLERIPSAKTIFVCGNGDIAFARLEYVKKIVEQIKKNLQRCPGKEFYFQSKDPKCFEQYLDIFPKGNIILITTLETDRDKNCLLIQNPTVPFPIQRYEAFKSLKWDRKIVTIEPIIDFNFMYFLGWIRDIRPEAVWIGYNSRPKQVSLDEPSLKKTIRFINSLRAEGIVVKEKEIRERSLK